MNIERKWMVIRMDTDGVTIVDSFDNKLSADLAHIHYEINDQQHDYTFKYGYPWEA